MPYVYATLLTVVNAAAWFTILLGLPGTWLMVLAAGLLEWATPSVDFFSTATLVAAVALALLGEVLEFVLGAAGSRKAGGSKRAAGLAVAGALVGGILGTGIPIPVVGTLVGACLGAFGGSLVGDLWAGRPLVQSFAAGKGAAWGRLWGTVAKAGVGGAIFLLLAAAAYA